MNIFTRVLLICILCGGYSSAHADAADDNIRRVCSGLSQIHYSGSKITREDPIDMEILLRSVSSTEVATVVNRAKVTGAAHACGEETASVFKTIQIEASSVFKKDSPESKRFKQIIDCTEARFQKIGLRGNWSVATLEFCPQAKKNFHFYVRERHPFAEQAPQVGTKNRIP